MLNLVEIWQEGDNKRKKQGKRKQFFLSSFTHKRQVVLKIIIKAGPNFYSSDMLSKTNRNNDSVY